MVWAVWTRKSLQRPFECLSSASAVQRLPHGVVLRHRLLARRLASGRAQARVQGAGGGAAAEQGADGGGDPYVNLFLMFLMPDL